MKLLMIYASRFAYQPMSKTLDDFTDETQGAEFEQVLVAFIHAEKQDESDPKGVEEKLLKNLKWAAKKNDTQKIVLHSFAHLAESKADAHFTKEIFDRVEVRLEKADYTTSQTPFGYFLDLDLQAPGISQARIFKGF
ncbi:MAG: hypothetical protein CVT99_16215 [Bacteroidetes bacterium HGW-Bacteroidetes-16]|jgi:hypothetical protein|nr:MAG: hypothetical protein CVT99_16215 [Bacteroidetes bacterium HGW-Bacteroidetes-16]